MAETSSSLTTERGNSFFLFRSGSNGSRKKRNDRKFTIAVKQSDWEIPAFPHGSKPPKQPTHGGPAALLGCNQIRRFSFLGIWCNHPASGWVVSRRGRYWHWNNLSLRLGWDSISVFHTGSEAGKKKACPSGRCSAVGCDVKVVMHHVLVWCKCNCWEPGVPDSQRWQSLICSVSPGETQSKKLNLRQKWIVFYESACMEDDFYA